MTDGSEAVRVRASWRDYLELTKPKVVALIVFTAIVGTLLASPGAPPMQALLWGNLGIALAAACAATLNHVLDRRIDEQMARTRARPLPSGTLTERQALVFAAVLGFASMTILSLLVNLLTAVLTFASLIGYAVIYTVSPRPPAAGARLDGGHEHDRSERAAAVPHHLRVDASALLGAGDRAP
jgi:protoheme IX farnesyltransferase